MPESSTSNQLDRTHFNSAKRLHDVLFRLKASNGANGVAVVPPMLGFANQNMPNDPWMIFQAVGLLERMIDSYIREIGELPVSQDTKTFYVTCLPTVISALSPLGYARAWDQIKAEIRETDLVRLEHVELALRQYVPEREVAIGEFEPLQKALQDARIVLNNTDLPDELRRFVSDQLSALEASIAQYHFQGIEGMRNAIAGYVGSLVMYREGLRKVPDDQKLSLKKVVEIAKNIFTLAHIAHDAWPLLAAGGADLIHLLQ